MEKRIVKNTEEIRFISKITYLYSQDNKSIIQKFFGKDEQHIFENEQKHLLKYLLEDFEQIDDEVYNILSNDFQNIYTHNKNQFEKVINKEFQNKLKTYKEQVELHISNMQNKFEEDFSKLKSQVIELFKPETDQLLKNQEELK